VREKMIAYLQSNHPESLPRIRTEFRAESLSGLALDGFNTLNSPAFSPGEESKSGR
jgi:hypothetical protein